MVGDHPLYVRNKEVFVKLRTVTSSTLNQIMVFPKFFSALSWVVFVLIKIIQCFRTKAIEQMEFTVLRVESLVLFSITAFQDVLRNSDTEMDWIFKLSFAYDIANVTMT